MEAVQLGKGDAGFIRELEAESRQTVSKCYQCGNCTAGCDHSVPGCPPTATEIVRHMSESAG